MGNLMEMIDCVYVGSWEANRLDQELAAIVGEDPEA